MSDNLRELISAAKLAFDGATSLDDFKNARLAHLGDKSPIALANRELGQLASADRAARGQEINAVKAGVLKIVERGCSIKS